MLFQVKIKLFNWMIIFIFRTSGAEVLITKLKGSFCILSIVEISHLFFILIVFEIPDSKKLEWVSLRENFGISSLLHSRGRSANTPSLTVGSSRNLGSSFATQCSSI